MPGMCLLCVSDESQDLLSDPNLKNANHDNDGYPLQQLPVLFPYKAVCPCHVCVIIMLKIHQKKKETNKKTNRKTKQIKKKKKVPYLSALILVSKWLVKV